MRRAHSEVEFGDKFNIQLNDQRIADISLVIHVIGRYNAGLASRYNMGKCRLEILPNDTSAIWYNLS